MMQIEPPINFFYKLQPDYKGKKVVINGGRTGIGKALADLMESYGAEVLVHSKKDADLSTLEGVLKIHGSFNGADLVFNNVGLYEKRTLVDTPYARWQEVFRVNVDSAFLLTKYALKQMNEGGVIVNMASRPTLEAYHSWGAYTAAKNAVIILTKAAAEEGKQTKNIHCYSICPSRVDTKFRDEIFPQEDKTTRLSPLQVAQAITFLFNRKQPNGSHYWIKQI